MSISNQILPKLPLKILPEERVQIARDTNRIHMPREVQKWIQSLDLSYKIRDITKDLSNGFSVAEILSRYPVPFKVENNFGDVTSIYTVNMKEFSNGSGYRERTTNWEHIKRILKKYYGIPISNDTCEKIINKAPNVAFEFLCQIYKSLTKRNAYIFQKTDETDKFRNYQEYSEMPNYMKPTASRLVKDSEVQRIKDDVVREYKLAMILEEHKNHLNEDRLEFMSREKELNEKKKLMNKSITNKPKVPKNEDTSQLKSNDSNINSNIQENIIEENKEAEKENEESFNLLGSILEISNVPREIECVQKEFELIIQQNFIDEERTLELELRSSEDKNLIKFFFGKKSEWKPKILDKLFNAYQDKAKEFVGIISRSLHELIPFINIVCEFENNFYKNGIENWSKFKDTTLSICESIKKSNPEICESIFINYCIQTVINLVRENPLYRNEMCRIIFSLIMPTPESHTRVFNAISKYCANSDELLYYHLLVQCINNVCYSQEFKESINVENVSLYMQAISKGLCSSCDHIKIKAIYLAVQLMEFAPSECIIFSDSIFRLNNSTNWEILSLILIYCSKMLEVYNAEKLLKKEIKNKQSKIYGPVNELDEQAENTLKNAEDNKSQINSQNLENIQENTKENNQTQNNNPLEEDSNAQIQSQDNLINLAEMEKKEEIFVNMINQIFEISSPFMTVKIGFIYLASILEYYPELAKKYMKILIEYKDKTIRTEVLKVSQTYEEEEYTSDVYTERYKKCGAPKIWNQLVIAGIFRDYIKEKNLARFEYPHILILYSILIHQDFEESDSLAWINLYNDLKEYIFISLCDRNFCQVSINICKKLFNYPSILQQLLNNTFDLLISTMNLIYEEDNGNVKALNQPHENMKELLTFISKIQNNNIDCKEYIYKLIKTFAIKHDKLYLKSNLLPLMNDIYNERRGKIFNEKNSEE